MFFRNIFWIIYLYDVVSFPIFKICHTLCTLLRTYVCIVNHKGSAPAMERDGTIKIFQRSMSTRNLQYTTFVGDGDTKSFTAIENMFFRNI